MSLELIIHYQPTPIDGHIDCCLYDCNNDRTIQLNFVNAQVIEQEFEGRHTPYMFTVPLTNSRQVALSVSDKELPVLLEQIREFPKEKGGYHLLKNNCADFVAGVMTLCLPELTDALAKRAGVLRFGFVIPYYANIRSPRTVFSLAKKHAACQKETAGLKMSPTIVERKRHGPS